MTAQRPTDERVLVIVPTYNERENLPLVLDRVRIAVPDADILVVDDGSPDGTGEIADQRAADDERISVMHRTEKNGLGAAYIAGFGWGLDHGYDILVEMDADGSHPPEHLPRLLSASAHADLVIGSRYVPGGKIMNWPFSRHLISRGGNLYVRAALGLGVKDVTAGYRAYRAQVLRTLDLPAVSSRGYCFQVEMTMRTVDAGFAVAEVPITFTEREIGESKMTGDIVQEAYVNVTKWGIGRRWNQVRHFGSRSRSTNPDSVRSH